eukprot:TRINITY_DN6663_c0_g1_i3.p1 TRINITY_DN6663_c0_g1~~TRINITY_DN6663_c0_g1_i3.p1  ORF type:complete len:592 (-),score=86.45 TRINITY_DN6663_c0_g1_i3:621-2297(-)
MSSSGSVKSNGLQLGDLCLKGTFLDVKNTTEVLSPRPASDPGNTSTADTIPFFAAETRYVEELSSLLGESCGGSTLATNTMDTLPNVQDSLAQQGDAIQANRVDLIAHIQGTLEFKRRMLGQKGYFDALSVIGEIPKEVRAVVRRNIASVVQGIMAEVRIMSDDLCGKVSQCHGAVAGEHARALASQSMEVLPTVIRSKLDSHLVEAHIAMCEHVDLVVKGLRSRYIGQQDFTDVAMKVSRQVQEILAEKVGAATQACFEDAQRRIDAALYSLSEPQSPSTLNRRRRRVPTAEMMQAAQNVLIGTVEDAIGKVEMMENDSALANEAVAETLLRAKTLENSERLAANTFSTGECQEQTVPNHGALYSSSPISPPGKITPAEHALYSASPVAPNTSRDAVDRACQSGSLGHPELCARPCVFAATGQCERGLSCDFCHMPHEKRTVHLDKKGRDALKRMTHEERVVAILPVVRTKIMHMKLDHGLQQDIANILNTMQPLTYTSDVVYSMQKMQRIQWTKLTLRSLFAMMKNDGSHGVHSELHGSLDRLLVKIKADVARKSC